MRLVLLLCAAACSGITLPEDDTGPAVDEPSADDPRFDSSTWPDSLGGEDRPARVEAPERTDGETLLPVVLLLHGYGASGDVQDEYFSLTDRVDSAGFVLIAPDGTRDGRGSRFWNATDACCDFFGTRVDDVGYLLGLVDEAEQHFPVDPDRITVIGHSNGGFMSYRLACEASDRLAGIASLAGAGWANPAECAATDPVSVLQMHGTADPTIAYAGGSIGTARYPGAEASVGYWVDKAACGPGTDIDGADYDGGLPGPETSRTVWEDCDGGANMGLWRIERGGHIPTLTEAWKDDVVAWLLAQRR